MARHDYLKAEFSFTRAVDMREREYQLFANEIVRTAKLVTKDFHGRKYSGKRSGILVLGANCDPELYGLYERFDNIEQLVFQLRTLLDEGWHYVRGEKLMVQVCVRGEYNFYIRIEGEVGDVYVYQVIFDTPFVMQCKKSEKESHSK